MDKKKRLPRKVVEVHPDFYDYVIKNVYPSVMDVTRNAVVPSFRQATKVLLERIKVARVY